MAPETPLLPAIQDEISRNGRIPFARFMELCLYDAKNGYYNSGTVRLGKRGDFYTSAHTGPVFARLVARHLDAYWTSLGRPAGFELIELGVGDGLLATELLSWIRERHPEMFSRTRYIGVEQSATLRESSQSTLREFADHARIVADWAGTEAAMEKSAPKYIVANEFLDALPVHLLVWRSGGWKERFVCLENGRLAWLDDDPVSPELAQQAESYFPPGLTRAEREAGWIAEISPAAADWIRSVTEYLRGSRGSVLILDYGYTIEEWQAGRFPQGSALAYRRHRVNEDLLSHPGDQDLTAHVNFSAVMEAAAQAGMRVKALESQSKFLMRLGEEDQFQDVFVDCGSELERLQRSQLLKTLILPQGMGEISRILLLETP